MIFHVRRASRMDETGAIAVATLDPCRGSVRCGLKKALAAPYEPIEFLGRSDPESGLATRDGKTIDKPPGLS